MTRLRALIVCETSLAMCAAKLRLGDYLLLGKGEIVSGGTKGIRYLQTRLKP